MNEPDFDAFLLGAADDQQHRACEDLLANSETVVNLQPTIEDDSLLAALRMADPIQDHQEIESLVEQVERLVPRHSITAAELNRFLDPPENPDELGKIGCFRIIEFLASGGMGLVFRAVDPNLDREVCVKLLSPSLEFNAEAKSRFERESREAARMASERIVTVLAVGKQNGLPFFVMPMLEGMSLRSMLDKHETIAPLRAIQITRQLAEGLRYAHDRQLLHRDIKPDNLWITKTGDLVILDFGLARSTNEAEENEAPITRQGTIIGTPSYMSPEQVTGRALDQRSDLFSVGVVLAEMLTGESPFKKSNLFTTMMSVAGDEIQLESVESMRGVPVGLRNVTQRLLHKDPDDRVDSARSLIELLDQVEACPNESLDSMLPRRKYGTGWAKTIAAGLVGVLISVVALAAWVANDKGTLVVSTSDPNVEVKIAGEIVSIHDPVSNRTYQIRIGETPLPSGVYQLESESENGDLAFSSQTIAIRRGEKTIVTVALVADHSALADSESKPGTSREMTWADTSRVPAAYAAKTRKPLIENIRKLPSLSLAESGFETSPALFMLATVQQPRKLKGIEAWTIEQATGPELTYISNLDRSLMAGTRRKAETRDGFVRIFDGNGELKTALPIPGQVTAVRWSNHAKDLIAVASWVREFDTSATNKYAITIWQITDTGARLIRSTRASNRSFNWDAGYRIVCFVDEKLTTVRLDTGTTWSLPDAAGGEFLYDGAVSPDGRFVATYSVPSENAQVSIWDLKTGEYHMAIPSGIGFQWQNDSTNIAVDVRKLFGQERKEENSLEIWNIKTRQMTKYFSKQGSTRSIVSPGLTTIAVKATTGQVSLTDASNRRASFIELPDGFSEKTNGKFSLGWKSERQLVFRGDECTMAWRRDDDDSLNGNFGPVVSQPAVNRPEPMRFEFSEMRLSANGELFLAGAKNDSVAPDLGDKQFSISLNPAGNSIVRSASYSGLKWPDRNYYGTSYILKSQPKPQLISPDGRFVLAWDDSTRSSRSHDRSKSLRVIDLENPERVLPIMNLEWIAETAWSNDGSLLIVRGREWTSRGSRDVSKVLDLIQWKERVVEGLPLEYAASFQEWNGGFVCRLVKILKENPRIVECNAGYFEIKDGSTFNIVDEKFNSFNFEKFQGSNVILSGRRFNESEQTSQTSQPAEYFRLSPDLKLTKDSEFPLGSENSWTEYFSFDGKFRIEQEVLEGETARSRTPEFTIFQNGGSNDNVSNLETELWKGSVSEFQWHPNSNSAIWRSYNNVWMIFAPESMSEPRVLIHEFYAMTPIESGWLTASNQEVYQLDFNSQVIGKLTFIEDESGSPADPAWMFADGTVNGKSDRLNVIYATQKQEFRVDSVTVFQRKFPETTIHEPKPVRLQLPMPQLNE